MKDSDFLYFLHLLKCGLDDSKPLTLPDSVKIGRVVEIACRQNVETAVYEALQKINSEKISDLMEKFKETYYKAISKNSVQSMEYDEISTLLNNANITFMPIKGIYLKKIYPKPYFRLMSDLDIYYEADNHEDVKPIFESLGYENKSWNGIPAYEEVFHKNPFMNVELHRVFISSNRIWDAYFANIISRSTNNPEAENEYFMSDEDACVFAIMHAAKHFQYTGFGIKPIMDLYVIFKERNPDEEAIKHSLEKYGLFQFGSWLLASMRAWFFGGINTAETDLLAEYICGSMNYGNAQKSAFDTVVGLSKKVSGKPNKLSFYLSEIFVNKEVIYTKYPLCQKHKILLPAFFFVRLASKLSNKSVIKNSINTASFYTKKNSDFYSSIEKIAGIPLTDNRFKE